MEVAVDKYGLLTRGREKHWEESQSLEAGEPGGGREGEKRKRLKTTVWCWFKIITSERAETKLNAAFIRPMTSFITEI